MMTREDGSSGLLSDQPSERRRRAQAGPYGPPDERRTSADAEDVELARRAGMPLHAAKRVSVDVRDQLLEDLRIEQREAHAAERVALWNRLADATEPRTPDGDDD